VIHPLPALRRRGTRIQAHRQFQADERSASFETRKEADVEGTRAVREQTDRHSDPCGLEVLDAAARHLGIGIDRRAHHARDSGGDQRIRARRSAPRVAARLERYIGDRTPRAIGGGAQRQDFSVGFAGSGMPPLADYLAIAHQHAAHARIRIRRIQAQFGQFQRARHPVAFRHPGAFR